MIYICRKEAESHTGGPNCKCNPHKFEKASLEQDELLTDAIEFLLTNRPKVFTVGFSNGS